MKHLIVTGIGRSGTTLAWRMLTGHRDIFISDESWYYYGAAKQVRDLVTDGARQEEVNNRLLMGLTKVQLLQSYEDHLCNIYSKAFFVHNGEGKALTERFVGDKCPPALTRKEYIDQLCYPRWVVVFRHPFDMALSWVRRWGVEGSLRQLAEYDFNADGVIKNDFETEELGKALLYTNLFRLYKIYSDLSASRRCFVLKLEHAMSVAPWEYPRHALFDWLGVDGDRWDGFYWGLSIGGDQSVHNDVVVNKNGYAWGNCEEDKALLVKCADIVGLESEIYFDYKW